MSISNRTTRKRQQVLGRAIWTVVIALVAVSAPAQPYQAWMESWDGPTTGTDGGWAVAGDSGGNIYVAGEVATAAQGSDGLLIKYDRSGKQVWERTYDGSGNSDDLFINIEIDGNDRIIVQGQSDGGVTSWDFITMVYAPDGTLLWEQRFDGLGNGYDLALGMDVDAQDNVCVVGIEMGADGFEKFTTIRYLPDGTEDWVARHVSSYPPNIRAWGYSVHFAGDGSVFAAGDAINPAGGLDYVLLKYDAGGILLWERLFDSSSGLGDALWDMALGPNDEPYLSGISETGTGFEYCVVKYDAAGTFQWEGRYGGTTGFHYGQFIEVDQDGNAFVTGPSTNSAGYFDWATVRFDTNGVQQWARRYQAPTYYFGDHTPNGIVLDDQGGIYVCGNAWFWLPEGQNAVLVKYDTAGNELWAHDFNGAAGGDDAWFGVHLDAANQVLVAGTSLSAGTGLDLVLAKFRQNGPPMLEISPMPLVPGTPATFTVSNVEPDASTYLAYSLAGAGNTYVGFLDVALGLANPKKAGWTALADGIGTAEWTFVIPGSVSGQSLWFQGVQYHVATNVVATSVQ